MPTRREKATRPAATTRTSGRPRTRSRRTGGLLQLSWLIGASWLIWRIPVPRINRITRIHHANPLTYSSKGEESGHEYAEAGSIRQRARPLPTGDALAEP